jgi:glycopeptide antibiotics resistance protein
MYKRLIPGILLVAYGAFLVKVMVLKDMPLVRVGRLMLNFGGTDAGHSANFTPFTTIVPYLLGYKGLIIAGINIVGNIALLVPLGFLAPFAYRGITWGKSLALGIASGLAIETLQAALRVGIFDIDDVILNALGFMAGYWIFIMFAKMARSMRPKSLAVAAIAAIVIVSAAAAYGYQKFPISFGPAVAHDEASWGGDPCGGTGGNGRIVSVGDGSIVMERNGGGDQDIFLADGAAVHTPAGAGSVSDLKAGERITLVGGPNPDGSFTAEAVFVCGAAGPLGQS